MAGWRWLGVGGLERDVDGDGWGGLKRDIVGVVG